MGPIPDIDHNVVAYLLKQDRAALEPLVRDLMDEVGYIKAYHDRSDLRSYHLNQAVSTLTELRRRLTRIEALNEISP